MAVPRNANPPALRALYDALLPKLKTGGVTIYLVPFATMGEDQTDKPDWWRHCSLSKAVSAEGTKQATQFGLALRQIQVPVGFVQSGEYCASLTTATFGLANPNQRINVTPDLNPPDIQRTAGVINQVIQVRVQAQLQLTAPSNVSVLSGARMTAETSPHPVLTDMEPGDTALFELDETAQPRLLAKLSTRQWAEMADYDKSQRSRSKQAAKKK